MESAFPTPTPPHATVDIRAAAAARGHATAPHAAAPQSSTRAHAAPRYTNAERPNFAAAADEETAAADQGNDEAPDPDGAEDDAEVESATAASPDEDAEAVTDLRGILGPTDGRYNAGLLRRAGSPTRADPGWAERPPPDGIERVAGAIILCKRRRAPRPAAGPPTHAMAGTRARAVTMATVRPPSLLNHSRQQPSCRAPRLCRLSTPPSSRDGGIE